MFSVPFSSRYIQQSLLQKHHVYAPLCGNENNTEGYWAIQSGYRFFLFDYEVKDFH